MSAHRTLVEVLRAAGIEDWNRVRITGGFSATDIDRVAHDIEADQYLLCWSSGWWERRPTVLFTNPQGVVCVIDVANTIVAN